MRLTARAPATSANLGPGFDCFGLALDLCNEVTIDTEAKPGVSWEGEGAGELPTDGTDLVSRAVAATVEARRRIHPDAEVPSFALHGVNRIPLERGLGSSSAAAVAGVVLGAALLGSDGWGMSDRDATAAVAAAFEGHADNVAPATFGGLTVVADGVIRRFDVAPTVSPVVLVPENVRISTSVARRALAEVVPRADAVFNIGHGALLVQALIAGDLELLRVALRDRLHQSVRLGLVPEVASVFAEIERRIPVCVSGSGPSLLAFESPEVEVPELGKGWRILRIPVDRTGVELLEG